MVSTSAATLMYVPALQPGRVIQIIQVSWVIFVWVSPGIIYLSRALKTANERSIFSNRAVTLIFQRFKLSILLVRWLAVGL